MPKPALALQLRSLRLPFAKAIAAARAMNVGAVEVDARGDLSPDELSGTGLRQVRKMLADLDLRVIAIGFRTRRGFNVEEGLEARIEGARKAIKFARDLGASLVVNQVGRIPADEDSREFRLLVEVLTDLAQFGQRTGALLAAETGSESGADLNRLLSRLPLGLGCATLNPGNLVMNGFPPLDALAALGDKISLVHIKDGVQDRASGRGVETPVGRGSVDFPAVLGALEEHGYRGALCFETDRTDEPLVEMQNAVAYLTSLY